MTKPIIPIGELISETLAHFFRDWRETLNVTVWFLFPPILIGAGLWLGKRLPTMTIPITLAFQLAAAAVGLIVTIRLTTLLLAKDRDPKAGPDHAVFSWRLFFSLVWIIILTYLAIVGGLIALVLPSIWLAVALGFGQLILLEDGAGGFQALGASVALVKGRWWQTLWRLILPGMLFFVIYFSVMSALSTILGFIAGSANVRSLLTADGSLVGAFAQYFVQSITQVLLAALFITWQVKLFHALKDSR